MGSKYLTLTQSATVNASGVATVSLAPAVGQFWAPSVVRVSTGKTPINTAFAESSYCAVYHGAPNQLNSTTFIDDTFLGSSDTSTIISGAIVLYGESITASWKNASPGDVAILTLYGRVYDTLEELQDERAPVPGAKFSGSTGNGMVWEYNSTEQFGPQTWSAGVPTFVTPSDSSIEIINVAMGVTTTAAVGNRFIGLNALATINGITVNMFWQINGTAQTASSSIGYYWNQGIVNANTGSRILTPLPSKMILPPITTIQGNYIGPDLFNDTWFNFIVIYRRYTSNTKVSYT